MAASSERSAYKAVAHPIFILNIDNLVEFEEKRRNLTSAKGRLPKYWHPGGGEYESWWVSECAIA